MEGSWLNRMTVIWGDRASHERIAKLCRTPILPTKGRGAEKIEIEGLSESPKVLEPSSGFTKWSLKEGKHWVAYNERAISSNPESQIEQSPASIACWEIERKHEEKKKSKIKLKKWNRKGKEPSWWTAMLVSEGPPWIQRGERYWLFIAYETLTERNGVQK